MGGEYTIDGYLGSGYQLKVLWQILTEPEFSNKVFSFLRTEYFDDPNHRRFFTILKEYYDEYDKAPNLQNKSVYHAITRYKQPNNPVDEDVLMGIVENIKNWNDRVLNKNLDYDGDAVQKSVYNFIKQGEYCDLAEFIMSKVKKGFDDEINTKIDQRTKKISEIGSEEDEGIDVFDDIERALQPNFREPIPTGIIAIDNLMGGGLGKGEIGIILAGTGVGKSTALTKIANEGQRSGKNVLHITFEDNEDEIRRKHFAIWSGTKLSEMNNNLDYVNQEVHRFRKNEDLGKLIIKKFPQDGITIPKIRQWIDRYKKKWGVTFDLIVLDYIDCVDPHERYFDQTKAEEGIIKAFEGMASDYNVPCWTAIQANRTGLDGSEFIGTSQMGGSIKRAQKTHFLMSVAKSPEQKTAGLANIAILKARFAADGQKFEDAVFDNDSVRIEVRDSDYSYKNRGQEVDENSPEKADKEIDALSDKIQAMNRNLNKMKNGQDLTDYTETLSGETASVGVDNSITIGDTTYKKVEYATPTQPSVEKNEKSVAERFAEFKNSHTFEDVDDSNEDIRKELDEMAQWYEDEYKEDTS